MGRLPSNLTFCWKKVCFVNYTHFRGNWSIKKPTFKWYFGYLKISSRCKITWRALKCCCWKKTHRSWRTGILVILRKMLSPHFPLDKEKILRKDRCWLFWFGWGGQDWFFALVETDTARYWMPSIQVPQEILTVHIYINLKINKYTHKPPQSKYAMDN